MKLKPPAGRAKLPRPGTRSRPERVPQRFIGLDGNQHAPPQAFAVSLHSVSFFPVG
jgi:hypothetical protein